MKKLLENFRTFINEYDEEDVESPYGFSDPDLGLDPSQDIEHWKEKDEEEILSSSEAATMSKLLPDEDWSTSFVARAGGQPSKGIVTDPPVADLRADKPELPPLRGRGGEIIATPASARAAQMAAAEAPIVQPSGLGYTPADMSVAQAPLPQYPELPLPSAQPPPIPDPPAGDPGAYKRVQPPKMPSAADTQATLDWAAQYDQAEKAGESVAPAPPEGLSDDDARAALDWARAQDPYASGLDPERDLEKPLDPAKDVEIGPEPEPEEWEAPIVQPGGLGYTPADMSVAQAPLPPEELEEPEEPGITQRPEGGRREDILVGGPAGEPFDPELHSIDDPELYDYKRKHGNNLIKFFPGGLKYTDSEGNVHNRVEDGVSGEYEALPALERMAAGQGLPPLFTAALVTKAGHETKGKYGRKSLDMKRSTWKKKYGDKPYRPTHWKQGFGAMGQNQVWHETGHAPEGKANAFLETPDVFDPGIKGYLIREDGTSIGGKRVVDVSKKEELEGYVQYAAQTWRRIKELGGSDIDAVKALKLRHRTPSNMWGTDRRVSEREIKKGKPGVSREDVKVGEIYERDDRFYVRGGTKGVAGRALEIDPASGERVGWPKAYKEWEEAKPKGKEVCEKLKWSSNLAAKHQGGNAKRTCGVKGMTKEWGSWGGGTLRKMSGRYLITGKNQGINQAGRALITLGYSAEEAFKIAIEGVDPADLKTRFYQRPEKWYTRDERRIAKAGGGPRRGAPGATIRESKTISRDLIRQLVLETIDKQKGPQSTGRDLIRDIVVNAIRNRKS